MQEINRLLLEIMYASPFHDSIPLIKQCKHCR